MGFRILRGLKDAIAWVRGDRTRARLTAGTVEKIEPTDFVECPDSITELIEKIEQPPIGTEFVAWIDRACPDCHGLSFREGPRGGVCVNLTCTNCGSRFNVARWPGAALIQRISPPGG